jgi:hypothetical protein
VGYRSSFSAVSLGVLGWQGFTNANVNAITNPAVVGDLLVFATFWSPPGAVLTGIPAGFNLAASDIGTDKGCALYVRDPIGSEPGSYEFTWDQGVDAHGWLIAYEDTIHYGQSSANAEDAGDTTLTALSIDTVIGNVTVLGVWGNTDDGGSVPSTPSGWTSRNTSQTLGLGAQSPASRVADKLYAAPSTTGNVDSTVSANDEGGYGALVALAEVSFATKAWWPNP